MKGKFTFDKVGYEVVISGTWRTLISSIKRIGYLVASVLMMVSLPDLVDVSKHLIG